MRGNDIDIVSAFGDESIEEKREPGRFDSVAVGDENHGLRGVIVALGGEGGGRIVVGLGRNGVVFVRLAICESLLEIGDEAGREEVVLQRRSCHFQSEKRKGEWNLSGIIAMVMMKKAG